MTYKTEGAYFKKEFWTTENQRYSEPHFRLQKLAGIVNRFARGRPCDLLDVGCGPAALSRLLEANVRYHGLDIALQSSAPNLRELDFLEHRIDWNGARFDIVVASGLFEYMGHSQEIKLGEIHQILNKDGMFVVSYINFEHIHRIVSPLYNNIQPVRSFKAGLKECFDVRASYPVSYNWQGTPPRRGWLQLIERHINVDLPIAGRLLGVEYFFICSPRPSSLPPSGSGSSRQI